MSFVNLTAKCAKCRWRGTVRVFRRDETRDEVARRHSTETRERCVLGCAYVAVGKKKAS